MKKTLITIVVTAILSIILFLCAGCWEAFGGGFVAGVKAADVAQQRLILAEQQANAKADEILAMNIDPETITAAIAERYKPTTDIYEKIKGTNWKEPESYIPTGLLLMSLLTNIGQYKKGKK